MKNTHAGDLSRSGELTREEHAATHDKLLEMQAAGLCKQAYLRSSLVLVWAWTDKGMAICKPTDSITNPVETVWRVAARCVLSPSRW